MDPTSQDGKAAAGVVEPPHGEAAEPSHGHGEEPGEAYVPFFPDFILLEALTALVLLIVLVVLAASTSPTLDEVADPSASGFIPRPEWYFLWAFQMLKYFKGEMEVVGTFLVPTLLIGALVALPFLDRRVVHPKPLLPHTRPVRKWPRVAAAALIAGIGALTLLGAKSGIPVPQETTPLSATEELGKALYDKMGCASCHAIAGEGGTRGPDLTDFGSRADANERVLLHFGGVGQDPDSIMPGYNLTKDELNSLAAYLLSLEEP